MSESSIEHRRRKIQQLEEEIAQEERAFVEKMSDKHALIDPSQYHARIARLRDEVLRLSRP